MIISFYLAYFLSKDFYAKKLIRTIAKNYKLPYYTITPTFSICPKHGYLTGEHKYCPKCDKEIGYDGGK